MNKVKGYWKILAIIFISLFALETIIFGWVVMLGTEMIENEIKCQNYCMNEGGDSFYYDEYTTQCYCYEDDELVLSKDVDLIK